MKLFLISFAAVATFWSGTARAEKTAHQLLRGDSASSLSFEEAVVNEAHRKLELDLTGTWWYNFEPTLNLVQTGNQVNATWDNDDAAAWDTATGTIDGDKLTMTFDNGHGTHVATIHISGHALIWGKRDFWIHPTCPHPLDVCMYKDETDHIIYQPDGSLCFRPVADGDEPDPDHCEPGCCVAGYCKTADDAEEGNNVCPPPCADNGALCTGKNTDCATYTCVDYNNAGGWDPSTTDEDGCELTVSNAGGCCETDADCTDTPYDCKAPVCTADYTCEDVITQGVPCYEEPDVIRLLNDVDPNGCCNDKGECLTGEDDILNWCPCVEAPGNWSEVPEISYDPVKPSNLVTDYSNDNLELETDAPVKMTFDLLNFGDLTADEQGELNYGALIFDDERCQGTIIGQATQCSDGDDCPDPHMATKYQNDPSLVLTPLSLPQAGVYASIDASDPAKPVLAIKFWPRTFRNPFYHQDFACLNQDGDPSKCGLLTFCTEFQVLDDCGRKLNFIDVKVDILFDLLEDCTGEFCGEIVMQRSPVIEDSDELDLGSVKCYPCDPAEAPPGTGDLPAIRLEQGYEVEICMDVEPDVDGVCIVNVESLYLEVTRFDDDGAPEDPKLYPILPTDFAGSILIGGSGGGDANPNYAPTEPAQYVDENDATVKFLLPQFEFQELEQVDEYGRCTNLANPAACTTIARVTGTVLLGMGCYCADPTPESCDSTLPGGRKLQESGLSMVTVEASISITGEREEEGETLGFFAKVVKFIQSILSMLTFGLL